MHAGVGRRSNKKTIEKKKMRCDAIHCKKKRKRRTAADAAKKKCVAHVQYPLNEKEPPIALPAVAELSQVRQRLLRRPHHVLPFAQLVRERDKQLAVALALKGGKGQDARQVVFLGGRLSREKIGEPNVGGRDRGERKRERTGSAAAGVASTPSKERRALRGK